MFFVAYLTYIFISTSVRLALREGPSEVETGKYCADPFGYFGYYGYEDVNDCLSNYGERVLRQEMVFICV